ncbi:hypothetical protein PR048_007604 [Dryococelus australis]|uniref:Uncharacterized protein n=1 Tax=Dryococelus australis TaxID=614101 RepID=A0ABQ9HUP2_9NEOP|nr:hypothetical protein PR048_007604 [Dryococelus australis]
MEFSVKLRHLYCSKTLAMKYYFASSVHNACWPDCESINIPRGSGTKPRELKNKPLQAGQILRLETRRTRSLSPRHCTSKTSRDGGVSSADICLVISRSSDFSRKYGRVRTSGASEGGGSPRPHCQRGRWTAMLRRRSNAAHHPAARRLGARRLLTHSRPAYTPVYITNRCHGNTARLERRSDKALEVRFISPVSPPHFLTLDAGFPRRSISLLMPSNMDEHCFSKLLFLKIWEPDSCKTTINAVHGKGWTLDVNIFVTPCPRACWCGVQLFARLLISRISPLICGNRHEVTASAELRGSLEALGYKLTISWHNSKRTLAHVTSHPPAGEDETLALDAPVYAEAGTTAPSCYWSHDHTCCTAQTVNSLLKSAVKNVFSAAPGHTRVSVQQTGLPIWNFRKREEAGKLGSQPSVVLVNRPSVSQSSVCVFVRQLKAAHNNPSSAAVAERLVCSPSTKANQVQSPAGTLARVFARGNRAGRCRRVFSGISRSPRPYNPVLFHSHLISPSSALDTLLLRAAQISELG